MGFKNNIPDRWTEYVPVGRRIPGTRFIAFKVPLKNNYDHKLSPCQRFSPSDLITEVEKQNEELGLVVDLTCTMRYYSSDELPQTVMYSKIFTVGHEVPSDQVISQFKHTVKQYLSQNSENDKLVGVHCTHGLNRTGYLVCRYLIDLLSMEPSEAIEKFNSSRGHSIERSNYIDDLLHGKCRSNSGLDKPQGKQRLSGRKFNSGPPPRRGQQPQSHGITGLVKPQAKHQHFSRMNADLGPPPYPEEQPWSHGHTYDTPRWGPRSVQPSIHQQPGQVIRPLRGNPHSAGRYPSQGPRMPPPGFPYPHMPGPRHSLPQMEANQSCYFRGPTRRRHHPQRPFHQHFDAVNGALDSRPRFSPQNGGNPGNGFPAHAARIHLRFDDSPYESPPKPGRKTKPQKQWQ